ncbi:hypothetical protein [Pseudonocardia hydrocarbonoxydans]|uniref:Uncharacterized protein n=1 Tax=Pseudonocardia hydrocarbonoxydans TaxID=76726 RepID=A0A4Y3WWU9_9PSEU|nr:hypothetical protein [Pseudonocardia hydrocarbonoxydans]GEC21866.1 hypothetical protein PHY01_41490 [Pseudonocardia hydrocarbonoxydans]
MTDWKNDFMARMPAGFGDIAPGAGAPTEYDYAGNVVGFARTEDELYANRAQQALAIREAGGAAGVLDPARLDKDDRSKALPVLARYGVKTPERITHAMTVAGQVELALTPDNPHLDVRTVPVDQIQDRVREHIAQKQREAYLNTESAVLRQQAAHGVVSAFRASFSDVLAEKEIRDEFDQARDEFLAALPIVGGCRSIADAGLLDETGEGVAAWWRAVKSAQRMDKIVELLVWFAAPAKVQALGSLRRSMESGEILALSAEPVDTLTYMGALAARGIDHHEHLRRPADAAPFALYAAQVEAGCTLGLPTSAEEFEARSLSFNPYAVIADAMSADV